MVRGYRAGNSGRDGDGEMSRTRNLLTITDAAYLAKLNPLLAGGIDPRRYGCVSVLGGTCGGVCEGDGGMSDNSFSIDLRNRWTLEQALAYMANRPQPEHPSLTWLMEQLPEGVTIEFPRITEIFTKTIE